VEHGPSMRIVFFTSEGFESDELFLYLYANVAASFSDVHIVAVHPRSDTKERPSLLKRYLRKARYMGLTGTLEIFSSYPIQYLIHRRDQREVRAGLRALPRPPVNPHPETAIHVGTVNGPEAVRAIRGLEPDVIIQAGAGILRKQVFQIARIGTLNLHHGIAPLIKGMHSIYWALWEEEPKWLGATVHFIDEGIDTGLVLAYAPIRPSFLGERFASLFVRATELGVERLVDVLLRLAREERWTVAAPSGKRTYRSTISGWKLGLMEARAAMRRFERPADPTDP